MFTQSLLLLPVIATAAIRQNGTLWSNWGRSLDLSPDAYLYPTSIDEVQNAVRIAKDTGGRIRVFGGGHSSSPLVSFGPCTSRGGGDYLLSLDRMPKGIASRDDSTKTVEVWAGTTLRGINPLLWDAGYSLSTMPIIDMVTIAGAISTGAHGSSYDEGSMSSLVVGMTLVDGNGEVVTVEEDDSDLGGYRCSLGLLGIVVKVKLRVVDRFEVVAKVVERTAVDAITDAFVIYQAAKYVQISYYDDNTASVTSYDIAQRGSPYSRRSYERLSGRASFDFSEEEVFIPSQNILEAYAALRRVMAVNDFDSPALLIRVVKAEDDRVWLAPASSVPSPAPMSRGLHGNTTHTFAVEVYENGMYEDQTMNYKTMMEGILLHYGGRPHWAKLHHHVARDWRTLKEYFPRVGDFLRLRQRCDPHGVFMNDWLQRELLVDEFEKMK